MAQAYLQRLAQLAAEDRLQEAAELSAEALEHHPDDARVLRARAIILRRSGDGTEAAAFLAGVLERQPGAAWAHAQYALTVQHRDPRGAIGHYREALRLEPGSHDYRFGLIHALGRWGDQGNDLEEAYRLLQPVLPQAAGWGVNDLHIAFQVLKSVCAYDELEQLGPPLELGRRWAEAGDHTALFNLLSEVGVSSI